MSSLQVYLNGNILPIEKAHISPLDRAFLFGDAVYEVIPVFDYQPFALSKHLDRLSRSLESVYLPNPHSPTEWTKILQRVIACGTHPNQGLYLQISRGAYPHRDHTIPDEVHPTLFIAPFPMNNPNPQWLEHGLSLTSAIDKRWHLCHIKTTALMGHVLLHHQAIQSGTDGAILFRDGYLSEATSSNIFVVKNRVLLIVPADHNILQGITYEIIVQLAKKYQFNHDIRPIARQEVFTADEVWISSSLKMLLPVTQIDGKPIGQPTHTDPSRGTIGHMFKKMRQLLLDFQKEDALSHQ